MLRYALVCKQANHTSSHHILCGARTPIGSTMAVCMLFWHCRAVTIKTLGMLLQPMHAQIAPLAEVCSFVSGSPQLHTALPDRAQIMLHAHASLVAS